MSHRAAVGDGFRRVLHYSRNRRNCETLKRMDFDRVESPWTEEEIFIEYPRKYWNLNKTHRRMHLQQSTWNFQLRHVLLSLGMLLLLKPSPFLFIHRFVCVRFRTSPKYTTLYLFIFLFALLKALCLAIQNAPMDGQQSSLSVVFETVRFSLQYRLFWLLSECVTYQGFEANLQGRKTIVKIRDFGKTRKLTSGILVSLVTVQITLCCEPSTLWSMPK